jgi:hypothetical protein
MLAILIWLLCVGISAILIGFFIRYLNTPTSTKEGFLTISCPIGTTSFVTHRGETHCCNGDIVDNWCNGNVQCSLSPNRNSKIPSCSDYVVAKRTVNSAALCPKTIPNYFASADGSLRGCSVSQSTADGSAPLDPNQLQCILYPTLDLEKVRLDSCYNYNLNLLASAKCASGPSALSEATTSVFSGLQSAYSGVSSTLGTATDAITSPTGYVFYGENLPGTLPVINIIDAPSLTIPGGKLPPYKIYIAQTDSTIFEANIDINYTKIQSTKTYMRGSRDMTKVTDYKSYMDESSKTNLRLSDTSTISLNIKKVDGSNIIQYKSTLPSATASPGDYIIYGGNPELSSELHVSKILRNSDYIIYCVQDAAVIRYIFQNPYTGMDNGSSSSSGTLTSINSVSDLLQLPAATGARYKLKKTDGTIIIG